MQVLSRLRNICASVEHGISLKFFERRYHSDLRLPGRFLTMRPKLQQILQNIYTDYTTEVSSPDMAISCELGCMLLHMCLELRPLTILDLGSGFSSAVFRLYQKASEHLPITIYTVDDDILWLEKTKEFLKKNELNVGKLMDWDSFLKETPINVDLLLHDLGSSNKRCVTMQTVPLYAHKRTVAILDDLHKAKVRQAAMRMIRSYSLRYTDLRQVTIDQFGRYQWVVFGFKDNMCC